MLARRRSGSWQLAGCPYLRQGPSLSFSSQGKPRWWLFSVGWWCGQSKLCIGRLGGHRSCRSCEGLLPFLPPFLLLYSLLLLFFFNVYPPFSSLILSRLHGPPTIFSSSFQAPKILTCPSVSFLSYLPPTYLVTTMTRSWKWLDLAWVQGFDHTVRSYSLDKNSYIKYLVDLRLKNWVGKIWKTHFLTMFKVSFHLFISQCIVKKFTFKVVFYYFTKQIFLPRVLLFYVSLYCLTNRVKYFYLLK